LIFLLPKLVRAIGPKLTLSLPSRIKETAVLAGLLELFAPLKLLMLSEFLDLPSLSLKNKSSTVPLVALMKSSKDKTYPSAMLVVEEDGPGLLLEILTLGED
jgi:hypothetical protein